MFQNHDCRHKLLHYPSGLCKLSGMKKEAVATLVPWGHTPVVPKPALWTQVTSLPQAERTWWHLRVPKADPSPDSMGLALPWGCWPEYRVSLRRSDVSKLLSHLAVLLLTAQYQFGRVSLAILKGPFSLESLRITGLNLGICSLSLHRYWSNGVSHLGN